MKIRAKALGAMIAATLAAAGCSGTHPSEPTPAQPVASIPAAQSPAAPPLAPKIPPYFESAKAAKPFPPLIPASFFRSNPIVARAYRTASQYPGYVAQQPCYCHCNRLGHRSLLDCYSAEHAAG